MLCPRSPLGHVAEYPLNLASEQALVSSSFLQAALCAAPCHWDPVVKTLISVTWVSFSRYIFTGQLRSIPEQSLWQRGLRQAKCKQGFLPLHIQASCNGLKRAERTRKHLPSPRLDAPVTQIALSTGMNVSRTLKMPRKTCFCLFWFIHAQSTKITL